MNNYFIIKRIIKYTIKMRKVCIFDWAGTMVDKGSYAPLYAFKQTLKQFNIKKSDEEINKHMGMDKFTHLYNLLGNYKDTLKIYPFLIENLKESISKNSIPVSGINNLLSYLKTRNYLIGSTSGYNRSLLNIAINTAFIHKMQIPYNVASDEVTNSRPYGDMIIKNLNYLKTNLSEAYIIKVGDTVTDIKEGQSVHAFMNIGISNNKILTKQMYRQGATHVVEDITELFKILH
jgi:phosphonoacetaldehyde hydrolase